jgi:hypothetical protein
MLVNLVDRVVTFLLTLQVCLPSMCLSLHKSVQTLFHLLIKRACNLFVSLLDCSPPSLFPRNSKWTVSQWHGKSCLLRGSLVFVSLWLDYRVSGENACPSRVNHWLLNDTDDNEKRQNASSPSCIDILFVAASSLCIVFLGILSYSVFSRILNSLQLNLINRSNSLFKEKTIKKCDHFLFWKISFID